MIKHTASVGISDVTYLILEDSQGQQLVDAVALC